MSDVMDAKVREAIKETMLHFEEVSRVVANANITMLGNLSLEEEKIVEKVRFKKEMYQRLVLLYKDTEYIMNVAINEKPTKIKKIESMSKKLKELRDQRLGLLNDIKTLEAQLESIQVGKEGGSQIHEVLFKQFDKLREKLDHARVTWPAIYEAVEGELNTFFKINLGSSRDASRR